MNVRTRGPHSPTEPPPPRPLPKEKKDLMDPKLWNPKGPSLSWEITKMGRTSGGIRRQPGSVRLWMHTMEMERASREDHTFDDMLSPRKA